MIYRTTSSTINRKITQPKIMFLEKINKIDLWQARVKKKERRVKQLKYRMKREAIVPTQGVFLIIKEY